MPCCLLWCVVITDGPPCSLCFHLGSGDLNSGPEGSLANALPTVPSPQHWETLPNRWRESKKPGMGCCHRSVPRVLWGVCVVSTRSDSSRVSYLCVIGPIATVLPAGAWQAYLPLTFKSSSWLFIYILLEQSSLCLSFFFKYLMRWHFGIWCIRQFVH